MAMVLQAALVAAKTEKGVMSKALRKTEALLREMVAVTLRNDLTRNQRTALETCITVHMHQKARRYPHMLTARSFCAATSLSMIIISRLKHALACKLCLARLLLKRV